MPKRKKRHKTVSLAGPYPAIALALALILGGGGSPAPAPELVLQLLIAGVFAAWVWTLPLPLIQAVPRTAWLLAGLVVALPLVQLLPLPPMLWQALPGREIEREALALIGADDTWRSWSLAPARTLAALLALLPALAVMIMTAAADRLGRQRVVAAAAAITLLTVLLGAAQLSGGPGSMLRFYVAQSGSLDGFQANRNSTADVLLVGLVAIAAVLRERSSQRSGLLLALGAGLIVSLAVVLTGSRTGIVLLPLAIAGALAALGSWVRVPWRTAVALVAALLVLGGIGSVLLANNGALTRVAARFDSQHELRPDLWRDSAYVARQHLPFGVGAGNFVPAMIAGERLEIVRPNLPNRAHNEYLELAVEGGLFALGLLLAVSGVLAAAAKRARRDPPEKARALAVFACSGLVLLALHSLVDYPLRSMALACLGAVCAGLLLHRPSGHTHPGTPGQPEELE